MMYDPETQLQIVRRHQTELRDQAGRRTGRGRRTHPTFRLPGRRR